MSRVNGGQVLVKELEQFGVNAMFTLCGGHIQSILAAARDAGIRLVDHRHEQAAAWAAQAYGRVTGDVGVVVVTHGGAVTNVTTPIAASYTDGDATVVIAGVRALRDLDTMTANDGIDQVALMRPITKWSAEVPSIERLPDMVARAFQIAREGRPGPVYLQVPSDVSFAVTEDSELDYPNGQLRVARPAPSPETADEVIELLRDAKRPAIIAGGGLVYSRTSAALLTQFAELTGIPVMTNNWSRGAIPTDHPLWARTASTLASARGNGANEADVVLILGLRLGQKTGGRRGNRHAIIPQNATVIQVDIEPEEIGRMRDIEVGVNSDCGEMLKALLVRANGTTWPDRSAWAAQLVENAPRPSDFDVRSEPGQALRPVELCAAAAAALPRDGIMIGDGSETVAHLEGPAQAFLPNRWMVHGHLAPVGAGLGRAIGAQVAYPDARVMCVIGDGAVGFNFSEFDTMVRHNLPIVTVINNDAKWAMLAHSDDLLYGEGNRLCSDLLPSRYDVAASGFGAYSELVERVEDLRPAIDRAFASGRPACINVITKSEIAKITQRFVGNAAGLPVTPDGKAVIPWSDGLVV
jgi:acetolactate synthase I/II/III large subunit